MFLLILYIGNLIYKLYCLFQSQIPGPVTAEQLEQQKEKKAQQKKAKRQREKEKQADKLKANAFLQLTDEKKVWTFCIHMHSLSKRVLEVFDHININFADVEIKLEFVVLEKTGIRGSQKYWPCLQWNNVGNCATCRQRMKCYKCERKKRDRFRLISPQNLFQRAKGWYFVCYYTSQGIQGLNV